MKLYIWDPCQKPRKDFGWFRLLKFDPLGAQPQLQLQNSACWKLPINPPENVPKVLGWPLLSNPWLPRWALGLRHLLLSSTKNYWVASALSPSPAIRTTGMLAQLTIKLSKNAGLSLLSQLSNSLTNNLISTGLYLPLRILSLPKNTHSLLCVGWWCYVTASELLKSL